MSDDAQTLEETQEDQFRAMRAKANAHDTEKARADAAERQLAFVKAGVPLDDKTTYFVKGYDGDLDPEAIRAEALRVGAISGGEEVSAEEQQGMRQVTQASAGAEPVGDTSLTDDLNAISPTDPLASEKIYAVMAAHGRWPPREF